MKVIDRGVKNSFSLEKHENNRNTYFSQVQASVIGHPTTVKNTRIYSDSNFLPTSNFQPPLTSP
ncbi:hypothetical protein MMU07_01505 [Aquiflexum sp. LQ15W]|uniref:hypothetical protein n=1 Tax=Cognataquiflexum nitidum TaxID=2922272 RepID=UPI001F130D64|nr:hypothetical protein [Cognataquiflexum nitidum]MCH6198240.1 hypothetical protein [Cognataquiflexum nitidum]